MSQVEFSPYRHWLSLEEEPSNFYVLLGLRPLENDRDVIRAAAGRASSRVRNAKPGDQIGAWKSLLDQIEQARESLCDPGKKQIYDRRLRGEIDQVETPLTVPSRGLHPTRFQAMVEHVPDPMSPLDDAEPPGRSLNVTDTSDLLNHESKGDSAPPIRTSAFPRSIGRAKSRRKRRWAAPLALVVSAAGFLAVSSSLWIALRSDAQLLSFLFDSPRSVAVNNAGISETPTVVPQKPERVASNDLATPVPDAMSPTDEPLVSAVTDGLDLPAAPKRVENAPADQTPRRADVAPDSNDAPVGLSPEELRQFGQSLHEARRLLTDRDFDESKVHLDRARRLATAPDLEARVERLDTLHQYVLEFWQVVEDGFEGIENTELVLNDNRVFVVAVTPREIVLRVEGQNRRFDRSNLPPRLAMAIADRWFNPNASSTKVFKGAFMAVAPGYSDQQVREMWQQAQQEGADLGDLVQVLDEGHEE